MAEAEVKINEKLCKGCEICVELCPVGALEIKNFKAGLSGVKACIGCMACELRCPDFAITVVKKSKI